jgi:eukaryotic-like serine/threonine-protein kinase
VTIRRCPRCQMTFDLPARYCAYDRTLLIDDDAPLETADDTLLPNRPPPLLPDQVVDGRYQVVRRLGEGGMSFVYHALDQRDGSDVAIKVLSPRLAGDPRAVDRLRREARMAQQFDHPSVCRILDLGETGDGLYYLTMPYLRGESLNESETRRGPYPVNEALVVLVQLCEGLQHAHDLEIIHRDLKPENVMLVTEAEAPGGIRAVVMDFGLGKALEADPDLIRLTQSGVILGTPEFMSPEQVRGERLDTRSDIFSLGVLGFELLTGQLPFAGRTSQEAMMARLRGQARTARAVRPDVPARVDDILSRALALRPADRYHSMAAFAADLGTAHQKGFLGRLFSR